MAEKVDDEAARRAQAAALREQIERLKSGSAPSAQPGASPPSPRDFIEEKMRNWPKDEPQRPD